MQIIKENVEGFIGGGLTVIGASNLIAVGAHIAKDVGEINALVINSSIAGIALITAGVCSVFSCVKDSKDIIYGSSTAKEKVLN